MFQDLDDTLKHFLHSSAAPFELRNADISFETPDKNYSPTQATVNLFLYEVKENRELRDPVPIVEKSENRFVRRQPPLRVTCDYIITAWSNQVSAAKIVEEHRLLGQALAWLSGFPNIPNDVLQGSLKHQPFPLPTLIAQLDGNKIANEFWVALGGPPRASFHVAVTIAMDLNLTEEGSLVTTRLTTINEENWIQIGGQVLDIHGDGIAEAFIDVLDAGVQTLSDISGNYTLTHLSAGSYTLRAIAVGFEPQTKVVTVPGLPKDYEFVLAQLP